MAERRTTAREVACDPTIVEQRARSRFVRKLQQPPPPVTHGSRDVSELIMVGQAQSRWGGTDLAVVNIGGFAREGSRADDVLEAVDATVVKVFGAEAAKVEADRARREREAQQPAIKCGSKVLAASSAGGEIRAEVFKEPRVKLWKEYQRRQPIGVNEFCRQIDRERPSGIAPMIDGYDNIRHHLRVAKRENSKSR
jgi:hypothetical protein